MVVMSYVGARKALVIEERALPHARLPQTMRKSVENRLTEARVIGLIPGDTRDDVFTVISELVTNAVRHSPPHHEIMFKTTVATAVEPRCVRVAVWDSSDGLPEPRACDLTVDTIDALPDVAGEHDLMPFGGWGIPLVMALAANRGTLRTAGGGKWVWAELLF